MTARRDPSKALQVGFLVLLGVSSVQAGWWIVENVLHTRKDRERLEAFYAAEAEAVAEIYAGAPLTEIGALLPQLEIDPSGRAPMVTKAALEALDAESRHRTSLYVWEGGFFLAVLLAGMIVLTRTIRHDAELRRRQQNFLAAVSHEFKSPLASMRLAAETLLLRAQEPDSRRLGQRILDDGDRLLRMVDNLLDTTRLEEGRHVLAAERTDLRAAAEAGIAEISERTSGHGIAVALEIEPGTSVSTDPSALETILRNLLDNAVKACVAGDGHAIAVRAARDAGRVTLTVDDDGLGFPPEDAEMMFEKFYRLGDELRRSSPGTGLGLYIVKRLADLGGAHVHAHSDGPGRGASVSISWPADEAR